MTLMREIKFRAWNVQKKRMYYATPYRGYIKSNGSWWALYNGDDVVVASSVYDDKLMQYTGLKDKNGVEIYEGDIVKIVNGTAVAEIDYPFLYHVQHHTVEVIGNIYENKELLDEQD